jgi:hypothetical protein
MLQVLETRGVPNKAETCRKWVRAMAGKLGRSKTGEILEFDPSVSNTPITAIFDRFCGDGGDREKEFAERRDSHGPPKL